MNFRVKTCFIGENLYKTGVMYTIGLSGQVTSNHLKFNFVKGLMFIWSFNLLEVLEYPDKLLNFFFNDIVAFV